MCADWDRLKPTVRKAWNLRELTSLHVACGGFLEYMACLKQKISEKEFNEQQERLRAQFMLGALDADIEHSLEVNVPPVSLQAVQFLRTIHASIEKMQLEELQKKDRDLARKVVEATYQQVKLKLDNDIEKIMAARVTPEKEARQALMDLKYLSERQQTLWPHLRRLVHLKVHAMHGLVTAQERQELC